MQRSPCLQPPLPARPMHLLRGSQTSLTSLGRCENGAVGWKARLKTGSRPSKGEVKSFQQLDPSMVRQEKRYLGARREAWGKETGLVGSASPSERAIGPLSHRAPIFAYFLLPSCLEKALTRGGTFLSKWFHPWPQQGERKTIIKASSRPKGTAGVSSALRQPCDVDRFLPCLVFLFVCLLVFLSQDRVSYSLG